MRRDAWQALADPTRREIIEMLAKKSFTVNEIAHSFAISRPAVSKHLKILTESGLLHIKQKGRSRHCSLKGTELEEVFHWVSQFEVYWLERLDRLDDFLSSED